MRKAFDLFEQAAQKDSALARAYLGISETSASLSYSVRDAAERREVFPLAKSAATKALQLDPSLAQAHVALANVYFGYEFDWQKAEVEYKRATELAPRDAAPLVAYGLFLATMRRFDEALAAEKRAGELEPASSQANIALIQIYGWMHREDEAVAEARRATQKTPAAAAPHFFLGFVYVQQKKPEDAIREFRWSIAHDGGSGAAYAGLAYAQAVGGHKEEALKVVRDLEDAGSPARPVGYPMAAAYAALGNTDEAFRWLGQAVRKQDQWLTRLEVDPVMDPLRTDPRFADVSRRVGFPGKSTPP